MRLALLTNLTTCDSLPVLAALDNAPDIQLVHIYFYDTVSESKSSPLQTLRQFGAKKVATKVCQMLGFKLRRMLAKWNRRPPSAMRYSYEYAESRSIPHSVEANINQQSCRDHLALLDVDILLVCTCKNILRAPVLSLPRLAAVNIHPSKLPEYRGPMPVFWAMLNNEKEVGITIHEMVEKIDQGPILFQDTTPLRKGETEAQVSVRLFSMAADKVVQVLMDFQTGKLVARPHESMKGSYQSYPTAADRRRLESQSQANRNPSDAASSTSDGIDR